MNSPGLLYILLVLLVSPCSATPPIADVHIHYKWSQVEVTSEAQVIETLDNNNVQLAAVIGTPAELALTLTKLRPGRILALWSPYTSGGDWLNWAYDVKVIDKAVKALASGQYSGIGELHIIGGFSPKADSPVISGLFELAEKHNIPILLHTELSRNLYIIQLCEKHSETRILWAHAGAILSPESVNEVLESCPNVWVELSARDPWRFINNPITDANGKLLTDWQTLVLQWQDRIMVGSDPVWPVDQMDQWDTADTGWLEYHRFIDFHRRWLSYLPPDAADKIRLKNAQRFFYGTVN